MIRVTLLGTAAARPTPGRNVSALAVQHEGDLVLWDCGEGTQRQMMRFATGFNVGAIFITHTHADHYLGVPGLLRTLGLQGHQAPVALYGPPGSGPVLRAAVSLGNDRLPFPVRVEELAAGDAVGRKGYAVEAFAVSHGVSALGFALQEPERLGRFDVERARALGVPEGPAFGRLHRGEVVEGADGRMVSPEEVVGPPRPGRRVVYTGDTRPTRRVLASARGADLLVHEATFAEDERDRARATGHATALGAARLAREAGVGRLVLTHLSARYADDPSPLRDEARSAFPGAAVGRDGMVVEVPFRDEETGP
ncbi:MAG: ribonuclease Z [Longimicrobiales bacterium]|nr:ribonuclease Z [Longimicrobiales bacterium]